MKNHLILLLISIQTPIYGASIQVNLGIQSNTLKNLNGTSLTAGTPSNGDGAILQLGYYTASTTSDPFSGDWVPMTGPGTPFPTTIGDSGNYGDSSS